MASPEKIVERQTPAPCRTGLVLDDVYLKHLSGNAGHPERLERLTAIRSSLQEAGLLHVLDRIKAREATQQELALAHSSAYLALVVRELSGLND